MGRTEEVAALRPAYQAEIARGLDRFFEPQRATCPWCASPTLRERLRTGDLVQRKPGTFVVDECVSCGHRFQNPRLNTDGLDFYYRDFYDGLGKELAEFLFNASVSQARHRTSVRSVLPFCRPARWLDVGTGSGHFPAAAKEVLPDTAFDGLDLGQGVAQAEREGRIERAHRGPFTELAAQLSERYDVVSMFHYLEHTPDPRAELAAARTALRPGGHLLIEVPNPESWYGRVLGRWWMPWFQPQHLHFVPPANLCRALAELGFTVVTAERRESHIPNDLCVAACLFVARLLPHDDSPWHPHPPTAARRAARRLLTAVAAPAVMASYWLDQLLAPLVRRSRFANAYRVVARKD